MLWIEHTLITMQLARMQTEVHRIHMIMCNIISTTCSRQHWVSAIRPFEQASRVSTDTVRCNLHEPNKCFQRRWPPQSIHLPAPIDRFNVYMFVRQEMKYRRGSFATPGFVCQRGTVGPRLSTSFPESEQKQCEGVIIRVCHRGVVSLIH